jgi:hypothetical protein
LIRVHAGHAAQSLFAFTIVTVGLLSGCGGGSNQETAPSVATPISVAISPATMSVQVGQSQPFIATVTNDSAGKGVTWALSGASCNGATCGTLSAASSASGTAITYTAPANAPTPPAVTLTATSVTDPTKTAAAAITVTAAPTAPPAPPPIAVSLAPPTASVQVGLTQPFTATVTNDSANKGLTWTLSGAGCSSATCGTLSAASSASGAAITYTAPVSVPAPPTVTLTATSVTDTTKSAPATITVTPSGAGPVSVTLTPRQGALTLGQSLNFTATVTNDVAAAGVTWSASTGTFSAQTATTTTYVAPASPGSGITVTATSKADVTQSSTATIGVTDLAGVTTYHNDLSRDGVNAQEYVLNPTNVAPATFGKLFSCAADGAIYAQPLWAASVTIAGGTHNVIVAATAHDSVYAYDADANPCITYWHANLLDTLHGATAGETTVPSGITGNLVGAGAGDITPEVGVIGTPVIDPTTNTIYVVSKSVIAPSTFFQRLHALDLATGNEKFSGPVAITASAPGNGDDSSGGNVPFEPQTENQRPGLALVNGVVYVAWASHEDTSPFHGWIIGFNPATLAQVAVFNDTPNGNKGGIWMSGGAPAADSPANSNNGAYNLYAITGNGTYDGLTSLDFGDSVIKLNTTSGLAVADWFAPADQATLAANDTDFGSGGAAMLIDQTSGPVPHLVIGGGKEGNLFLLNRDNMGHNDETNHVVQTIAFGTGIFATPAFWQNSLYLAGSGPLQQFSFNPTTGQFGASAASQSSASYGFPGSSPSVSSQGAANGIVWAISSNSFGVNDSHPTRAAGPAVIHAYPATGLTTELWNSSQAAGGRDTAGNAVKFIVPTVANGKVYIGTRGNDTSAGSGTVFGEVDVYGLLPN